MRTILTAAAVTLTLAVSAAAQSNPVYKAGKDGVKSPVLVREVKPQYTQDAKERQVQGTIQMQCVIETDGSVSDIKVVKSLDRDLDQQAVIALQQWQFRPGTKDDRAVRVQVDIEMTFTLR